MDATVTSGDAEVGQGEEVSGGVVDLIRRGRRSPEEEEEEEAGRRLWWTMGFTSRQQRADAAAAAATINGYAICPPLSLSLSLRMDHGWMDGSTHSVGLAEAGLPIRSRICMHGDGSGPTGPQHPRSSVFFLCSRHMSLSYSRHHPPSSPAAPVTASGLLLAPSRALTHPGPSPSSYLRLLSPCRPRAALLLRLR
jgi:hypothetical protein